MSKRSHDDSELIIPEELNPNRPDGIKSSSASGTSMTSEISDLPVAEKYRSQKFYLFNMVSPSDNHQKCDVHAFRMLAVCKTEQEAKTVGLMYGEQDPRFTIYQGEFGRFVPWVFDPNDVKDGDTQHREMRTLLDQQQRQQQDAEAHFYDRVLAEKMAAHKARFARKTAEESGDADAEAQVQDAETAKGNAITAQYNIRQLTNVCRKRLAELKFWKDRFAADFTDEQRDFALAYDYPPDADLAPMFVV